MKKTISVVVLLASLLAAVVVFVCDNPDKFENPLDKDGSNYLFGDTTNEKDKITLGADGKGEANLFDTSKYTQCDSKNPTIKLVEDASGSILYADAPTGDYLTKFRKWMRFDGGNWPEIITYTTGGGNGVTAPAEPCLKVGEVCKTVFSTEEKNKLPANGAYQIVYRVTKPICNGTVPSAEVTRHFTVETFVPKDIGTVVVALSGQNEIEIREGTPYTESGWSVRVDMIDGTKKDGALDSAVIKGTNTGNAYKNKVDKPTNAAAVAIPQANLTAGSTYSITYYASYKGADMPSAAVDSKIRTVKVLQENQSGQPAVIVLKPYKHKLGSKDVYYPDTMLVLDAKNENYIEKGVDSVYYMSGGEKKMLDTSLVRISRPTITGTSSAISKTVNYDISAGSGYTAKNVKRNVFMVDNHCEEGNIPPDVVFPSSSSSTIDAGKVWDYNASWTVTNKDEMGVGGQGFKFFIDFDKLNPNNPAVGTYTVTYVGLGKCGGRTEKAREITVK